MIVQCSISVDSNFGSFLWFFLYGWWGGQAPFCGGGPSPGFSELGTMPVVLSSKTEFSMIRLPPEFEPE